MRPVMKPLIREFIDSCRREEGRIIRGDNMTRIETFVDAAFAFALTMLVISIGEVPKSPPELFELSKAIPAFCLQRADHRCGLTGTCQMEPHLRIAGFDHYVSESGDSDAGVCLSDQANDTGYRAPDFA